MSVIFDTQVVLQLVGVSLLAGIGVTAAFSLAILGATRFADLRRDGRLAGAALFGLLTAAALGACVAGVVYGIYVIQSK